MSENRKSYSPFEYAAALITTVFSLGLLSVLCMSLVADGKITHCYIDQTEAYRLYKVVGFRNWRSDSTMGIFVRPEDALAFLKEAGCKDSAPLGSTVGVGQ